MAGTDLLARAEAERQTERVLAEFRLTQLPIDLDRIAHELDIEVVRADCDGPSGCLLRVGNAFGILISTTLQNDGFERFTLAHEFGHYFMPDHTKLLFPNGSERHYSRSGFSSDLRVEREADLFAAALLMPAKLFRDAMREAGTGFPAIERLATRCRASLTATAIQFAAHADDPVVVVVSEHGRVCSCFFSSAVSDLEGVRRAQRGSAVPRRSCTHAFHRDVSGSAPRGRAEGESYLDEWIDGAPELRMDEDVVGLGDYGKVLTVLHSTEEFEPDDDGD